MAILRVLSIWVLLGYSGTGDHACLVLVLLCADLWFLWLTKYYYWPPLFLGVLIDLELLDGLLVLEGLLQLLDGLELLLYTGLELLLYTGLLLLFGLTMILLLLGLLLMFGLLLVFQLLFCWMLFITGLFEFMMTLGFSLLFCIVLAIELLLLILCLQRFDGLWWYTLPNQLVLGPYTYE